MSIFDGMKKWLLSLVFIFAFSILLGQGFNHAWLMGYTSNKMRINFDISSYTLVPETRKMSFKGTEGNISDENGNFLMSSNGVWIANANNDTMMNGSGLNPGPETLANPDGLVLDYANTFFPYPGDSSKYVLFHHTCEWNGFSYPAYEVFYTVIDMTFDGGLGGVDSAQKNIIAFQDTLNWGLAACKHANGRDWWIVAQKHNTDIIYKVLFTPTGISTVTTQQLNCPYAWYSSSQLTFSPDGNKFAYTTYDSISLNSPVLLFDFNRCTGMFSNTTVIPLTTNAYLFGLAFSPNSEYVYSCTALEIFQIKISTLTIDTVAIYDGFASPFPPFYTTFFNMYLAANGKIYTTSGSTVLHIHEMNYPNNAGLACDVQQHAIALPGFHKRNVPNHPNYYLGCDTTGGCPCYVGIEEPGKHDFKFSISPNPNNGNLKIIYLLPQNKEGKLEIFDVTGKCIYMLRLPMWSTLQQINLPDVSNGIYNCVINAGNERVSKKVAVIKE